MIEQKFEREELGHTSGQAEVVEQPMDSSSMEMKEEEVAHMEKEIENLTHSVPEQAQSPETKQKKGFFARLFSGAPSEKAIEQARMEIQNHPSARNVYEDAKTKGRGEEYVEAFAQYGLPLYWNGEKNKYQGQPWNTN